MSDLISQVKFTFSVSKKLLQKAHPYLSHVFQLRSCCHLIIHQTADRTFKKFGVALTPFEATHNPVCMHDNIITLLPQRPCITDFHQGPWTPLQSSYHCCIHFCLGCAHDIIIHNDVVNNVCRFLCNSRITV